jgi:hypothetical protein
MVPADAGDGGEAGLRVLRNVGLVCGLKKPELVNLHYFYKCSKTTLSTRGSEGANESGSFNQVATVNLKSHFSPQPFDR